MKKVSKSILTAAILAGLTVPSAWSAEYTTFAENTTAQKQISNLAMYRIVLSQDDCPTVGSPTVGQEAYYDTFNAKAIEKGYSGSLHYMQITGRGGNTEWALVEAPNNHGTSIYHLGFAREGQAGDVMNRIVTGTNFYTVYDTADMPLFENITADADGVKALKNTNLLIESWPFNYSGTAQGTLKDQNGNNVTMAGAHGGSFDWNDTPATNNNHGSYQYNIFDSNARTGQTFFDFNCLYRPHQNTVAGIGDADSFAGSYDWTSATNTILTDRSLQVYAMPNYLESDRIFNGQSANDSADWEAASSWLDGNGSIATAPTAGNDVFVNLGSVTLNTAAEINMLTVDPHGSLTITSDASLNVKGENYIDGKGAVTWIEGKLTSAGNFTAKDEVRLGTTASGAELILTGGTFNPKTLHIGYSANRSASATIDNTTVIAPQGFFLGNSGTGTADIRNSVITANTTVGNSGSGTLNLHNSTLSGNVSIANNQNSSGTMTVTGADTKITSNNFNVGYRGNGTFIMYDGSITAGGYFCVGNNQSYARGSVTQYGGTIQSAWFPLGHNGSGTWDMYGGTIHATGTGANQGIALGDKASGNFTFNMNGGEMKSNGWIIVGHNGKGEMNVSGGTITANNRFTLAPYQNSVGTMNMTGGSVTAAQFAVGEYGTGTLNLYDGRIRSNSWFLVGFYDQPDGTAPNVVNQYGGTVDCEWFVMNWSNKSSAVYNMFGGELYARGNGNPMIIGRAGSGAAFNLYDGQVTAGSGINSNINVELYDGYGVKVGGHETEGTLNIYAGDMDVKGKMNLTAASALNFETSVKGLGTLTVEGAFEQNGGKVSVAHNDAISFTDDYSLENGKDIMTVGGKTAVTVTNDSANILETAYDTATGKLNVKFSDDAYVGSIGGNSELSFAPTTAGWVELEDFNSSNPFVLELLLDTHGMEIDAFVDILNAELNPSEEELWVTASASGDSAVEMTFMPLELVGMDVLSWDFSSTDLYGANGVAVIGLDGNEVPEPTTWILLALGCGLLAWTRNRKKA